MEKTVQATASAVIVLAGLVIFTGCAKQEILGERTYIPAPHASVNVPPTAPVYVAPTDNIDSMDITDTTAPAPIADVTSTPTATEPATAVPTAGGSRFKPFVGTMSGPSPSEAPDYKGGASTSTAVAGKGEYIVQKGDSLSVIAQRHKVKTADLAAVNNLQANSVIRVGQKLKLPQGAAATAAKSTTKPGATTKNVNSAAVPADGIHVVKSGDSLWKVARQYNTSIKTLCELNNISENTTLKLGQKLKVSANASTPAETTKATPVTTTPSVPDTKVVETEVFPVDADSTMSPPPPVPVPTTTEPPIATQTYLIQRDMTLVDYCRLYKWDIDELIKYNPNLTHESTLRENETIVLPSRDSQ